MIQLVSPRFESVKRADEYIRSAVKMCLNLAQAESRGYWKYHTPGNWFKQAKSIGKITNEKSTMLFDFRAEVSIIDTTFARKGRLHDRRKPDSRMCRHR